MKRTLTILSATLLTATSAQAVESIEAIDWNGDQFASFGEMMIAYPGIDREDLHEIDSNGDNRLDFTELYSTDAQNILARHEESDRTITIIADSNGDGFADYQELSAVYTGLSDLDFDEIDVNDDNRVNTWEFYEPRAQTILARYEMNGPGVADVDALDSDGDDFISFEELTAAYSGISQAGFEDMDTNDDQRLDFSEFYTLEAQNVVARHEE